MKRWAWEVVATVSQPLYPDLRTPGSGWAAQITCSSQEPLVRHPTFQFSQFLLHRVHQGHSKGEELMIWHTKQIPPLLTCNAEKATMSTVCEEQHLTHWDGESKGASTDTASSERTETETCEDTRTSGHIYGYVDTPCHDYELLWTWQLYAMPVTNIWIYAYTVWWIYACVVSWTYNVTNTWI